eukprot:TRINITY_DN772_c0_g1_i1.p1 TRINITY_DN772_c0_g1~~TRINITY_DN772_c0_g1_i1.p1  ORF type:complete len:128 (+),score=27.28 TRINITY_DN772_c0_g1_i1:66-449(+)
MARVRAASMPLILLVGAMLCVLVMLSWSDAFVAPRTASQRTPAVTAQASTQEVLFKGGSGSVSGGGSSAQVSIRSSGGAAPSSPSPRSFSSGSSSGAPIADGNYVIGITVFFFLSVYANSQGFFGPW